MERELDCGGDSADGSIATDRTRWLTNGCGSGGTRLKVMS